MIGLLVLLVLVAGFVAWDRRSPVSASPDQRLIAVGGILAAVGAVASLMMWWLVVPVVVLLVGCTLTVIGRHRVVHA